MPNNQTKSIVWKTIPSEARVTRDEVSGYMIHTYTAVWKTVPVTKKASAEIRDY